MSDYFAACAQITIKELEGPNIIPEISYGREDVQNKEQAGKVENIPTEQNFKSKLSEKGFTDEEIVALASIFAIGKVEDPLKMSGTVYPKLDNYYYKSLFT